MFERIVARVPLLLMAAILALTVQVVFVQSRRSERLLSMVPLAVVTVLYLQAGRGGGGRGRSRSEASS